MKQDILENFSKSIILSFSRTVFELQEDGKSMSNQCLSWFKAKLPMIENVEYQIEENF